MEKVDVEKTQENPQEKPPIKKRKRVQVPNLQVIECVREFKLPQTYPSMANAVKKSPANVTIERIRGPGPQPTISLKIKSGKIDPNNKLQKLKLKSPDGRDLGEFDVQVLSQANGDSSVTVLKSNSVSPEGTKFPNVSTGIKTVSPTISSIKYLQKPSQEVRNGDQTATHGVLIPISPVVLNSQNYTEQTSMIDENTQNSNVYVVQSGNCHQIKVGNDGTVDEMNGIPLNFNKIKSIQNGNFKNTKTAPAGMKLKILNRRIQGQPNRIKKIVNKSVSTKRRSSDRSDNSTIDSSKMIKLDNLEASNFHSDTYYVVPDEETLNALPGLGLSQKNSEDGVGKTLKQIPRSSLGRVNLLRREKKDSSTSSTLGSLNVSTRSECDSTNNSVVINHSPNFDSGMNGRTSPEVDLNDLSALGEALRSLPDEELRNKALEALRSVGIGVERLVPKKQVEQIAIKDSETQTEVFGLLDKEKEEFIRACEDAPSLERISVKERRVQEEEKQKEKCRKQGFNGHELDSMLLKLADDEKVKEVNNIMKFDPSTEKLYSALEKDFLNAKKYDDNGLLNIHKAVLGESVAGVKRQLIILKACKINVDIPTKDDQTSLELAVKFTVSEEIIRLLLRAGANPTSSKIAHDSALTMASHQALSYLPLLIKHAPASGDLNYADANGFAPIHYCCQSGNYEGAMALIRADADLNVRDGKSGRTALFHAIENDELKIAKELLINGAKPTLPNFSGHTCYHLIDETKHVSLKDYLAKATK